MDELISAFKSAIAEVGEEVAMGAVAGALSGGGPVAIGGAMTYCAVKKTLDEFKEFKSILERPGASQALKSVLAEYGFNF